MFVTSAPDNNLSADLRDGFQAFYDHTTSDIVDVTLSLEGNVTCLDPKERSGVDSVTLVLECCLLPGVAVAGTVG